MYIFVNAKTVKSYKSFCSDTLNRLKNVMQNQYGFDCDFYLIGSGAKNLVTQNENELFDLDYNFEIKSFPNDFNPNNSEKLKQLKDLIRKELNEILKDTYFKDSQDSISVLTARLFFKNDPSKKEFSFDVAILAKNSKGNYCRLIHEKGLVDRFYWNEVPSSLDVSEKTEELKEYGWWQDVRDRYCDLKNLYLKRQDYNHPSFVVYVEAVNQVYKEFEDYDE